MTDELDIDTSICLHSGELPTRTLTVWPGTDLSMKLLRSTPDGAWRAGIVAVGRGESFTTDMLDRPAVQIYVLEGEIAVNGETVGANGFAVLPRSCLVEAARDTRLLMILEAAGQTPPDKAFLMPDCFAVEPFVPTIDGRLLEGFERRVLWIDERTGSDTRLLKVPGGFGGPGPNWHPVNEEIFCIEGDIQPDETRPMRAGSYLFNPARSIHGFDEKTEGGCILLEWHDGPWELTTAPGAARP